MGKAPDHTVGWPSHLHSQAVSLAQPVWRLGLHLLQTEAGSVAVWAGLESQDPSSYSSFKPVLLPAWHSWTHPTFSPWRTLCLDSWNLPGFGFGGQFFASFVSTADRQISAFTAQLSQYCSLNGFNFPKLDWHLFSALILFLISSVSFYVILGRGVLSAVFSWKPPSTNSYVQALDSIYWE